MYKVGIWFVEKRTQEISITKVNTKECEHILRHHQTSNMFHTAKYLLKPDRITFDCESSRILILCINNLIWRVQYYGSSLWAAQIHRRIKTNRVFSHKMTHTCTQTHTVFWDESLFFFINIQWQPCLGLTASGPHTLIQSHILK